MKILVCGDRIFDHYLFARVSHLCREAPVPVLDIDREADYRTGMFSDVREGGAALVACQLKELIGKDDVLEAYGSSSHKHRIFGDGHLLLRVDRDSVSTHRDAPHADFEARLSYLAPLVDAIVVSDYGKGAMDKHIAESIMGFGKRVYVDAKHSWDWYKGAYCAFPNRTEQLHGFSHDSRDGYVQKTADWPFEHVIRKIGEKGCMVDDVPVPPSSVDYVRDVCGAGDVFMAAFVARNMGGASLMESAHYANLVAGISVKHVGTHVVTHKEINRLTEVLSSLT